jgi:hypothetical protein
VVALWEVCAVDLTLDMYAGMLVPSPLDRSTVSARRRDLEAPLRCSPLAVSRMIESGSWSHGTGVAGHADNDLMAVASSARPDLPSSALSVAKTALAWSSAGIRGVAVSNPVVAVEFWTPPNFEVAPCWFEKAVRGFDVFWIGGRGDEWVLSAPQAHLAYVNEQNDRLSKKVKPLVRLLKAWKYHTGAPVSSFYLEMKAAQCMASENAVVLDIDLRNVIVTIIDHEARAMNDPQGIVGRIPACGSEEKRQRTLRLLREALVHLHSADTARDRGDRSGYYIAMVCVFGSDYPYPTW